MKPALAFLLIASLIGNLALAMYALRKETPTHNPTAPTVAVGPHADPSVSPAPSGQNSPILGRPTTETLSTPRTDDDLRALVARMRRDGYPTSVVRATMDALIQERLMSLYMDPDLPHWKQPSSTPESATAIAQARIKNQKLRESLLGEDGRPSAVLTASAKNRRYGPLSDEKFDAIVKLDVEYSNVQMLTSAARPRGSDGRDASEQHQLIEAEKRADLESLLTPEELYQYDLRNSPAARAAQSSVQTIDVSEAEYASLYEIQTKILGSSAHPRTPEAFTEQQVRRVDAQPEIRAMLGDERYHEMLMMQDATYKEITRFAEQRPSVDRAAALQLHQLQTEAQTLTQKLSISNRQASPAERQRARQTAMQGFNTRLDNLLGPEAAEAYKQQGPGRIFAQPPAGVPAGAMPAMRFGN
jgi:hypothetical protein